MSQFGTKHYWSPTPKKWKKIQKAVTGIIGVVGLSSLATDHPWVGSACFIAAGLTNELFELFAPEETNQTNTDEK